MFEHSKTGDGVADAMDAELGLSVVDVVFDGAGRDAEDERNVGEGFALLCEREALTFAACQVNAGENAQRLELCANVPMKLKSNDP